MKRIYKILLSLVCLTCFYILGNLLPFKYINIPTDDSPIKKAEHITIIINIASAFVTFLAVIVALFREDLRKLWEYAKLSVSLPDDYMIEVYNRTIANSENGTNDTLSAVQYSCTISVINSGNLSAENLEIHLEELYYRGIDYQTDQSLHIETQKLKWSDSEDSKITLSSDRHIKLKIVELKGPENQSSPNNETITIPASLQIAGVKNNPDFKNGKWIASLLISSTNSKSIRFTLEIGWNGKWEGRSSEMKNHFKVELNCKK
nr:hypothetical protein [uncultured Pedobacter sp.]